MSRLTLVLAVALAAATISYPSAGAAEVKIGAVLELSGPGSTLGIAASRGLKLAVARLNEKGGVVVGGKTEKVELLLFDNRAKPAESVALVERLIEKDGARVIFGPILSGPFMASQEISQRRGVIQISNAEAMSKILGQPGRDRLLKIMASQPDTAAACVPPTVRAFGTRSAVILVPNNEPGKIYVSVYGAAAKAAGVEIVGTHLYKLEEQDFYPVLTDIKSKNPDALWIGYTDHEAVPIVRQATELGLRAAIVALGTGITAQPALQAKTPPQRYAFCSFINEGSTDPRQQKLFRDYETAFGEKPVNNTGYSVWYYEALMLVAEAMERARTVEDTARIMAEIRGRTYAGIYDHFIDPTGLAHYGYYVGLVTGGKTSYTFVPAVKTP